MARKKSTQSIDKTPDTLDAILTRRYHGAGNIRGIRYQVLYSVLRALELYDVPSSASVRLEGIEDVDLLGFRMQDEFIQVKTAGKPWRWSQLGEPVKNFLESHRADNSTRFVLAVDFRLEKDVYKLAQLESLAAGESKRIRDKFRELTSKYRATAQETETLLAGLTIVSKPEDEIRRELTSAIAERFELGSEAVETYLLVLVAKFLEWAKERSTVTLSHLSEVRSNVGEALSREEHFKAYGRGLVTRVTWQDDARPEDFYEGKQTRPGHIVASADVDRPRWKERIMQALSSGSVCVLKSSSGQGKSTLLYRYAHDHWPKESTFVLQAARTPEDAVAVVNYLQHRANVCLPTFLLIDNAGWATGEWHQVVQRCVGLGIPVLMSVRAEDWYRFSKQSGTSYEVIEPTLDLSEAKDLFRVLEKAKRIHKDVPSAEWAFERIGTPQLLMEYIYLLTHGRMLEERLREQLRQFHKLEEDPAKLEVLRHVALAATSDCPVSAATLLEGIETKDDAQHVLASLEGEYLVAEGATLRGLHWVRSNHLVDLLHGPHASVEQTAIAVLPAIPQQTVSTFVAGVMCRDSVEPSRFISALAKLAQNEALSTVRAVIEGVYEGGEQIYFNAHRRLFDEAAQVLGSTGPVTLCAMVLPTIKVNLLDQLAKISDEPAPGVLMLQELASRFTDTPRGRDRVAELLTHLESRLTPPRLSGSLPDVGHILDWFTLCGVELSSWSSIQTEMLDSKKPFRLDLDDYCALSQAAYRYDEGFFLDWFEDNRSRVMSYLKFRCDCLTLDIVDTTLTAEFIVDTEDCDVNGQAVSRLASLRSAIPFCETYRSRPVWALPGGLVPSTDHGTKNLSAENNPSSSDVDKNARWRAVVERAYRPDSYYAFEEAWSQARKAALHLVEALSRVLERSLSGKRTPANATTDIGKRLTRLDGLLQALPMLPPQTPPDISRQFSPPSSYSMNDPSQWAVSLQNFLRQFVQFSNDTSRRDIARLAATNYYQALASLPTLHRAFDSLFGVAPDYFQASSLNVRESESYASLEELVDPWLLNPPQNTPLNIRRWARARKKEQDEDALARLRSATKDLEASGLVLVHPLGVAKVKLLRYLPIGFEASDPSDSGAEVPALAAALQNTQDVSDYFCLVPLHKGNRFTDCAHFLASHKLSEIAAGTVEQWEVLVPREIPLEVLRQLPSIPLVPLHKLEVQATIAGLLAELQCIHELREEVMCTFGDDDDFNAQHKEQQLAKVESRLMQLAEVASTALRDCDMMLVGKASPERDLLIALSERRWSAAEQMVSEGTIGDEHFQALRADT